MKQWMVIGIICAATGFLGACASSDSQTINGQRYAKKIYLTKEDYLEDIGNIAEQDRRELQPNRESEYIFNAIPQATEDTSVYFFDKHQQPKVPGQYTAQDYKNEKRLWKKPRRFSPQEYYGMQAPADNNSSTSESSYYEETSY